MRYQTEPAFTHGTPVRTGILLVNLGTPDAPTPGSVRTYLKEFLSDPRVVEMPRALWWAILNGIILNIRPKKSAAKYASIWPKEGSPLRVHTEKQASLLCKHLGQHTDALLIVGYAMRYGNPGIPHGLHILREQNCQRILIVPMYPQYAASTTATVCDIVFDEFRHMRNLPALRIVRSFHDHPSYIEALANNINEYWINNGKPEKLLMSFHGLPKHMHDKGDPYYCECHKTARLLAEQLGLGPEQYAVSFQSRLGKHEWLKPYTSAMLKEFGKQKLGRIDVTCPGFVADCLETLEEIAMEGKQEFQHAGGGEYHYIPCLNERNDWLQGLTGIVLENLQGWLNNPDKAELEKGRLRALRMGAKQ